MKNNNRPAVVIGTNVWVSALVYGGKPKQVIRLFISGDIAVIISEEMLTELRRIINKKFQEFIVDLAALEALIREEAVTVRLGNQRVNISRDPNDNMVIETAISGNAEYIITGDDDLLVLKLYKNIKILKPAGFLLQMENR